MMTVIVSCEINAPLRGEGGATVDKFLLPRKEFIAFAYSFIVLTIDKYRPFH